MGKKEWRSGSVSAKPELIGSAMEVLANEAELSSGELVMLFRESDEHRTRVKFIALSDGAKFHNALRLALLAGLE